MNNKIASSIIKSFLFLVSVHLISCSPVYYIPNTQNVNLFTQKGEVNLGGHVSSEHFDVQAAYAVSDQISMNFNGAFVPNKKDENGNGGKGTFAELGLGYYTPLENNFIFEISGNAGYGGLSSYNTQQLSEYPNTTGSLDSDFLRFSLLPAIGYRSEYISVAASARVGHLSYKNTTGSMMFNSIDQVKLLQEHSNYMLLEPALTVRAGLENIKLQGQLLHSLNLTDKDFYQKTTSVSLGVIATF